MMNLTLTESTVLALVRKQLARWGGRPENLLQVLVGMQQQLRHIPEQAIDLIVSEMSVPPARIYAVIDFYSFLHTRNQGDYAILFSDNIIERMLGSVELAEKLMRRLDLQTTGVRQDKRVSIGYTSCIGMSDQGPAALVNGMTLTSLTDSRIDTIADLIEQQVSLADWPTEFFLVRDNIRLRGPLLKADSNPGDAIRAALNKGLDTYFHELEISGLRGRGGAGFDTARKWRFCQQAAGNNRVVVCNADEGEPGTFKDRVLLQSYADELFDGMTLCAMCIGASRGFLYLRGEYFYLLEALQATLQSRRDAGLLGRNVLGQDGVDFDIEIHLGAGAYICGEESALIESLEGKRGVPRVRPPFPVTHGYLGRPTVVNNVETFIAATKIAINGEEWFRSTGTPDSPGTKLLSISGDCEHPGVYEYPFGTSIRQILSDCGAQDTLAVQISGAAGQMIPSSEFDRCIAFEDLSTGGSFMVFNQQRDLLDVVKNFIAFFVHESCGFCTPCRIGTSVMDQRIGKLQSGHATCDDVQTMHSIGLLMRNTSHCGLGATAANPVMDLLDRFPHVYEPRLSSLSFEPGFDLDAALEEARQLTHRDDASAHIKCGET